MFEKYEASPDSVKYSITASLLNAIEARLPLIRYHSEGVAKLAARFGNELGWNGKDLEMLEIAALLHDVGKIALPDIIMRKSGALDPGDWDIIQLHPHYSVYIIKPLGIFSKIIPWVYHHHEKWDGTGYPSGLKGNDIPIGARIITIADTFHAMTTERIYNKAFSHEETIEEIKQCSGKQFDSKLVEPFCEMIKSSMSFGFTI